MVITIIVNGYKHLYHGVVLDHSIWPWHWDMVVKQLKSSVWAQVEDRSLAGNRRVQEAQRCASGVCFFEFSTQQSGSVFIKQTLWSIFLAAACFHLTACIFFHIRVSIKSNSKSMFVFLESCLTETNTNRITSPGISWGDVFYVSSHLNGCMWICTYWQLGLISPNKNVQIETSAALKY